MSQHVRLFHSLIFTVSNSSCGKVMFSQASVILSTGGYAWQRGACMAKGGMCGKGGHAWQREDMHGERGDMHGKGGHAWQRGHVWQRGHAWQRGHVW